MNWTAFPTPFGAMLILWRTEPAGLCIVQMQLPRFDGGIAAPPAGAAMRSCAAIDDLIALLGRYFAGEAVILPLDLVALEETSLFQQRVLRAEYAIPRGRVSSYGLVAAHLGVPGAARAVGHALATNPFPILIPCHRAVRSDGSLGGYQGGLAMKRALLEMEGVPFGPDGRVAIPFHYRPDVA